MVEDALREGTAGGGGAESLGETEGLSDGKESLDHDEGSSGNRFLTHDNTATLGEAVIDTTNGIIGGLDFDQEDGLLEAGLGGKLSTVKDATASGGDLTTTTMDSISVEGHVKDVETAATEGFIANNTLLGGLLEGRDARVLDFVEELALLGGINKQVGASGLGAEAPNLLGIIGVPFVFVL
jgi:hypothetical protein